MQDILGTLFSSNLKVKIMRLFIFSPEQPFSIDDIKKKVGGSPASIRREVSVLMRGDFIKKKDFHRMTFLKRRGKVIEVKKKYSGAIYNDRFPFANQFKNLLMDTAPLRSDSIVRRFSRAGKVKLLVTSGIFMQEPESRLDLMIVGDKLNRVIVDRAVKVLEGEIGKELRYAVFDTPDFNYRLSVYDRLVRDVLDYPHQKLLNKINVDSD